MALAESMVTLVFTDLVSSTAVKKHLAGDDVSERNRQYFDTILQPHRQRVEADLASYGGRVVKTEGDAYFLVFNNAAKAVRWAVAIQKSHLQHPISTPLGALQVKIGMHTGSPLLDGDDFIGHEVDYAARVAALARGGEILLSEVTAVLVRSAQITGFAVVLRGNRDLKGIGQVPIFELVYGSKSVRGPVALPDKASETVNRLQPDRLPVADPTGDSPQPTEGRAARKPLVRVLFSSLFLTIGVMLLRGLGGLQLLELKAYDTLMQLRPSEPGDDRILVVTFTEADVQALGQPMLTDGTLVTLLQALEKHQPAVIGLDLYRDIPIGNGLQQLNNYFQQSDRLIGVCKVADEQDTSGIAPAPGMVAGVASQDDVLGFSNSLIDPDQYVRRHYLQLNPPAAAPCTTHYGFSLQLALRYLGKIHGIQGKFLDDSRLQLGEVVFQRLQAPAGGYQQIDDGGFQILLNYRATPVVAEQVTVRDVLTGKIRPQAIKNRIILVGVDREDVDRFLTPPDKNIAGVVLQAQGVSQIISAVLDRRSVLRVWPVWLESLWVMAWALASGLLVWRLRLSYLGVVALAILLVMLLSGLCFGFLLGGIWVPLIPPVMTIGLTIVTILASREFFSSKIDRPEN